MALRRRIKRQHYGDVVHVRNIAASHLLRAMHEDKAMIDAGPMPAWVTCHEA